MMFLRENTQEALLQTGEGKTPTGAQHRLWPLTSTSPASHMSSSSLKTQQTSTYFQLQLGKVSEGPTWPEGDKLWRQWSNANGSLSTCALKLPPLPAWGPCSGDHHPPLDSSKLSLSPLTCTIFVTVEKKKICFEGEIFRERSIAFLEKIEPEAYSSPPPPPSEMLRSSEKIPDGTVHLQRSSSRRTLP